MSAEMTEQFSWVPFFEELADRLVAYKDRQSELIEFLEDLRSQGLPITPFNDKDDRGRSFVIREIDPFTFLAVINRKLTVENRTKIAEKYREFLKITADAPSDFTGIPIVNNQQSWFIPWQYLRRSTDVPTLWHVFELAIWPDPFQYPDLPKVFDAALDVRGVNFNLTMGLFWVRPTTFVSLDANMRNLLNLKPPRGGLNFEY